MTAEDRVHAERWGARWRIELRDRRARRYATELDHRDGWLHASTICTAVELDDAHDEARLVLDRLTRRSWPDSMIAEIVDLREDARSAA